MITRRRMLKTGGLVGATALVTLNTPGLMSAAARLLAPIRTPDFTGTRLIAVLKRGSGPGQVGVRVGPGVAPGGPHAIAALRDGRLAILDTLNARITYLTTGSPSGVQDLPGAAYPLDIEVLGSAIGVFDPSSATVFVIRAGQIASQTLPQDGLNAISRITRIGDIPVLVEEDFASYDSRFRRATRNDGYPDPRGGRVTVAYGDTDVSRRRSAQIRQGDGTTFSIVTTHALGSVIALGRDDAGRSYFQVSELVPSQGGLDVDVTLRRFGTDGTPAGVARVPVRGRHSHPRRTVCFAPNGDAFALFPEPDQVRVLQLEWSPAIVPLAPLVARIELPRFTAEAAHQIPLPIANCRATAIAIGNDYAHLSWLGGSWIATSANLVERNGALRPVYLSNPDGTPRPGSYTEIPYSWGSMHVPQGFINMMNAGGMAGNRNTAGPGNVAETSGVDCSGMIQQCWGVGGGVKQDDTALMQWISQHGPQSIPATLSQGDMWRKPGIHVRMHHYYPVGGGGDYMYEATMDWGNKCYHTFRPWSDYPGYEWNIANFAC